jgi:hypothetical protein
MHAGRGKGACAPVYELDDLLDDPHEADQDRHEVLQPALDPSPPSEPARVALHGDQHVLDEEHERQDEGAKRHGALVVDRSYPESAPDGVARHAHAVPLGEIELRDRASDRHAPACTSISVP